MPHYPKPFFRAPRNRWFVQLGGRQHNLGPDKDEAFRLYHQMMAANDDQPPRQAANDNGLSIIEVYDKFLSWCEKHREPLTLKGYKEFVQLFVNHLGDRAYLPAAELRPFHVTEWVDGRGDAWGPTRRRNAIVHVQRPYSWAFKLGYIRENPIRHIDKPQARRREQMLTPAQWATIRDHYADGDPFRDLLEFCWETGARPQEARHVEARHLKLDAARVEIPPAEAKGRKRWRVIHLTERAVAILRRRSEGGSGGKVFLNEDQNPWTPDALNCRFCRLQKHTGLKHFAYALRHSFANRLLAKHVDHLTVAELLGHVDGRTLATTYQHLNQQEGHLKDALKKAGEAG